MHVLRRRLTPAIAAACLLTLAACGGHKHLAAQTTTPTPTPSSSTPTPAPRTTPKPAAAPAINPLTGGKPSNNPVVIVKIEDTALGRPQVGIDKADIVYITQVEGGLTRLMAVFDSQLPTVEPVRSTRADNPELAMEYGPVIYVASGGSWPELKPLYQSDLRVDINDKGGPGFSRDPNRPIPNNLEANLAEIAKKVKGPKAKSIGLVWSNKLEPGSQPGAAVHTTVGGTPVTFNWNSQLKRYVRIIGGVVQHAGGDNKVIDTPNVIVQFCRSTVYWKDRDVLGNPAEWTHTIGSGKVAVFRDGRRINGTWSRPSVKDGTVLRDSKGKPIALSPGGAWFVLVKNGTPLN